jgi:SAM-dependent methyltransferase
MMTQLLGDVATATLAVAAIAVLFGQCRKPKWWLGRLILWTMNVRHSNVTDWGLRQLFLDKYFTMLDVGCGGGRTLDKLAAIASEGKVFGIDYSAASVAAARRTNARWIQAGRVDILQGNVSRLPYPDGSFHVVTAVETHYYWPDLAADLREILRVLKPGGYLAIIAENYKGRRFDILYRPVMKLLRATYLSVSEHRDLFCTAGYADTRVVEERRKGWICVVGRRLR